MTTTAPGQHLLTEAVVARAVIAVIAVAVVVAVVVEVGVATMPFLGLVNEVAEKVAGERAGFGEKTKRRKGYVPTRFRWRYPPLVEGGLVGRVEGREWGGTRSWMPCQQLRSRPGERWRWSAFCTFDVFLLFSRCRRCCTCLLLSVVVAFVVVASVFFLFRVSVGGYGIVAAAAGVA